MTTDEVAAADEWGVDRDACRADHGVVRHEPTGRESTFGDLAEAARELPMLDLGSVGLKDREDWRSIAKPKRSLITPSIIKGEGAYGQDLQVDGMKAAVIARPPQILGRPASVDESTALEVPAEQVEAEYYMPHLAHSCMEPPAALAEWDGDEVLCWGCIQAPQSARSLVVDYCDVSKDGVTIQITWLGGGFGRKSKPDFFGEAAWLAREVGDPVKVV